MYPPKMYPPTKKPSEVRRSVTPKCPQPELFSSDDPALPRPSKLEKSQNREVSKPKHHTLLC